MKTHCVRADSSQALTSDIRSFVFLTDSSESQGSRIPYLLCILSVRSSWIFLLFPNAEVPFAIPHKGKNQGNFTGKYCTVLMFGSDDCSDCSWPDSKHEYSLQSSVFAFVCWIWNYRQQCRMDESRKYFDTDGWIRFLFTLYQSIFGPLFRYMLQINSNIPQKRKSLLLSCSIRRRFSSTTFLTFSFGTLRTSFSISRTHRFSTLHNLS